MYLLSNERDNQISPCMDLVIFLQVYHMYHDINITEKVWSTNKSTLTLSWDTPTIQSTIENMKKVPSDFDDVIFYSKRGPFWDRNFIFKIPVTLELWKSRTLSFTKNIEAAIVFCIFILMPFSPEWPTFNVPFKYIYNICITSSQAQPPLKLYINLESVTLNFLNIFISIFT